MQESPVKKYALEHQLHILTPLKLKDPEFVNQLRDLQPDLQVVVAFRMLPEIIWSLPPLGTFNLHASLLPQYRGAAPINHAIMNGERKTGVTTFFLDHQIDTGKVIMQKECEISEENTAGDLHDRLMELGAELVVDTVHRIERNEINTIPQKNLIQEQLLNEAPKIFKEDCKINWNMPATSVYNQIRGLSPYPTAHTFLKKNKTEESLLCKIYGVSKTSFPSAGDAGYLRVENKKRLFVSTADFELEILEIQLQGKKRMKVDEFLRGFQDVEFMRFTDN